MPRLIVVFVSRIEAIGLYLRVRVPSSLVVQVGGRCAPFDGRGGAQTEGSLVVDVDALRNVRQGDDIDVICGIGARRRDGGGLDETWKALPITIDVRINPIADRDGGTSVRVGRVHHGFGVSSQGERTQRKSSG
jgi:hypothetical protein